MGYGWPTFFYLEREGWPGWPKGNSPAITAQSPVRDLTIESHWLMRDPERVVHAAVSIIGVAGCVLIRVHPKARAVRDARESCGVALCEKTLRLSTTMAVYLLHRDLCWFFHVGADGVPLVGAQQTKRTE